MRTTIYLQNREKNGNSKVGHGIKEKMGKISGWCGSFSSVEIG